MFDSDLDELVDYVDSVTLNQVTGEDEWQKPVYGPDVVLERVRVDRGTVYSGSNNDRQIIANAVIYVRTEENQEMPILGPDWVKAKATIDGKPYTVTTVNALADPGHPVIWGYELEVL